jgi:translation initiation factor 1A
LIGLREFQQEKADIIHKYSADEARSLQAYGELPMHAKINQTAIDIAMVGGDGQEEDVGFDFEEVWNPHDVIVVFVRSFHERYLCVLCVQI